MATINFTNNANFNGYEAQNVKLQSLASDPTFSSGDARRIWYNGGVKVNNGSSIVILRDTGTLIQNGDLAGGIALTKLATDPLARANHTGTQTASTISDFSTAANSALATALANNSTADRNRSNHTGTQTASTISDLATTVKTYKLNEFQPPTTPVTMALQRVINLADPTTDSDAANKRYVDNAVQGFRSSTTVRVATASSLTDATASGTNRLQFSAGSTVTVDGVALTDGDRVLVKDQAAAAMNGIYRFSTDGSELVRTNDADAWDELVSAYVFVQEGTTNKDSGWLSTADRGGTLGTTPVNWSQFSKAADITAGFGLTKTGTSLAVNVPDLVTRFGTLSGNPIFVPDGGSGYVTFGTAVISGPEIAPEAIDASKLDTDLLKDGLAWAYDVNDNLVGMRVTIDGATLQFDSGTGNIKVATSGIDGTNLANGAVGLAGSKVTGTLPVSKGGTGATTATAARTALGAVGKYDNGAIHTAGASITITAATHGLGSGRGKWVSVINESTGDIELADVNVAANGDVVVTFGTSKASNTYRVVIIG